MTGHIPAGPLLLWILLWIQWALLVGTMTVLLVYMFIHCGFCEVSSSVIFRESGFLGTVDFLIGIFTGAIVAPLSALTFAIGGTMCILWPLWTCR